MRRIDDHDRVELEADIRPRSDIANARQKQGGDRLLIRGSLPNTLSHLLEQFRLRRVFDQPDQRLDSCIELYQCRCYSRLLGRYGRHLLETPPISNTETSSAHSGGFQKLSASSFRFHAVAPHIRDLGRSRTTS